MCVNQRWITNKYTGRRFLVKCGKCEACIQAKAALRSSRIRNEASSDTSLHPLFVTLTYDRSSCPFVLHQDVLKRVNPLPVYREHYTRRVRNKDGSYKDRRCYKRVLLDELIDPDFSHVYKDVEKGTPVYIRHLSHRRGKIGVCYFPDVQQFIKRLRINLSRKYNYDRKFSSFHTFEYGETTQRPHVHLLLFIPVQDEALFRQAILEAWPFADKSRTGQYIELCKDDAAGYVSSYVNCGSDFPKFLATNFKPKHAHSKLFGHGLKSFALDKILENVSRGDMQYSTTRNINGVQQVVHLPIPKYVINKFFPIFKGYSRLLDSEIRDILSNGFDFTSAWMQQGHDTIIVNNTVFTKYDKPSCFRLVCNSNYRTSRDLDYTIGDLRKIDVRLTNAFKRYHQLTGKNRFDYAIDFINVWRCYKSTNYRLFVTDPSIPVEYKYDNIIQYLHGNVRSENLDTLFGDADRYFVDDPNEFPHNITQTVKMKTMFHRYLKTKKVNNEVYSRICDYY